jgi:hypothetical protein
MMKRIGLIGGIGPESTVDYYKRISWSLIASSADRLSVRFQPSPSKALAAAPINAALSLRIT